MFIPADAGNIFQPLPTAERPSTYPRWRGEHQYDDLREQYQRGLSPLARGTHKQRPDDRPVARFIPAGAGNTPARPNKGARVTVYPRWRGEHVVQPQDVLEERGLSPLARGTRVCRAGR
ncbi:CRISPR associated protein of unknown function [Salmonella enterica]|nr:CRISPR associated protein of unknown function [Salmonella enterica]AZH73349.1 CRISPR associated protein of unknown function [Salmonella enterica subsp. enterica serovar Virchow]ESF01682.1 hypothetical protein SEEV1955_11007 [Salmonella enterica subsp. enterica serovar Virchow str. ATCC 51955]